jgi:uncharacterized protein (TIGR03643 family)
MTCVNKTDLQTWPLLPLSEADVSAIIAMAWQDDTPFEAIALQFGLTEHDVIALIRAQLKTRSFRVWRMRVRGRTAKHLVLQQRRELCQDSTYGEITSSAAQEWLWAQMPEDFPEPPSPITRQSLR